MDLESAWTKHAANDVWLRCVCEVMGVCHNSFDNIDRWWWSKPMTMKMTIRKKRY